MLIEYFSTDLTVRGDCSTYMSCGPRSELYVHILPHTCDHCHPHLLYTVTVCAIREVRVHVSVHVSRRTMYTDVLSVLEADPVEPGWDAGVHGDVGEGTPTLERAEP